ncbi:TDP-4-oxo-6-deoxy-alpha-D-glucose-3,4-oxoisomerase [bioreactor metagenome]|uniref:TDP-4-oxo-6-deoxy-alpha-D-glucose-3, 4-oxoisomerase n=1 Tax=bioreactor metagenome TaxID=1076179 RepID=A0A645IQ33_9ZZZZ
MHTKTLKNIKNIELGRLSVIEACKDIDFEIKRIYYITEVPVGTIRGHHAHKKLKQVLFCPYGEIEIVLDDGHLQEKVVLDSPEKAVVVCDGIWRTMRFVKNNSVLCVAASEHYDEEDYIRDYDDFIQMVNKGYWKDGNTI